MRNMTLLDWTLQEIFPQLEIMTTIVMLNVLTEIDQVYRLPYRASGKIQLLDWETKEGWKREAEVWMRGRKERKKEKKVRRYKRKVKRERKKGINEGKRG